MGEVDDLIREARAEALAAVKSRLRGRFERDLMEEAEARLSPARPAVKPTADPGTGLWVYCVAGGELPDVPPDVAGVAAGHAPRVLRAAGLAAVVSAVPLDEYGEAALRRNLNDMDWLEEVVLAHESVLEAVLGSGPIVPMRVCTIYSSAQHVEEMLAERAATFGELLARLAGHGAGEAARARTGHAAGAKAGAGGS